MTKLPPHFLCIFYLAIKKIGSLSYHFEDIFLRNSVKIRSVGKESPAAQCVSVCSLHYKHTLFPLRQNILH